MIVKLWIVQGWYGYGWEDLAHDESRKIASGLLRDYNENERWPHRLISRYESISK